MNLSLGGGTARLGAVAATVVLSFSLVACSGSDEPGPVKTTASAKPTPDKAAVDKADVTQLVNSYWGAVIEAENNADTDRDQFDGLAQGEFLELVFRKLDRYESNGIRRVGAPEIADIEVSVNGDTAAIVLCLNEDKWTATQDDKPLDPILEGNRPFGLTANRVDGGWLITDTGLNERQKGEKKCA